MGLSSRIGVLACLRLGLSLLLILGLHLQAAKPSLPEKYGRWLNQEVVYIISDEERKEFLGLKTDAERDKFVEEFWEIRNPLRGSRQNPFKEEHYRRLEYANQNFGRETGTPGWKTDMGRTWILFGKPQSRLPLKGYGQIYPLELWFYGNSTANPSLPSFYYVLFFIPEDIGDYRYYRPVVDGPLKLVRGSRFNTNRDVYNFLKPLGGDLAHAVLSLIPSEPLDLEQFSPSLGSEMLVSKIQNFANDPFNVQRVRELRYLRAKVTSWFLVTQEQPLDVQSIVLKDPAGQYWLDYAVLISDEKLGRPDPGRGQLIVDVGFRLLTETGELIVDDSEERAFPAFDGPGFKPFLVANRVPLVPGKYRLEVQVTNREAGRSYRGERKIEVEPPGRIALAGPLLAASVSQAVKPDPVTPFQYFGMQFLPATERQLSRKDPLRLLFQLQAPSEDSRSYQLDYLIAHAQNREQRRTVTEAVPAAAFQSGSLLKAKTIPLSDLEPGDYRLVLTLRAEGSAQALASATLPVKVVDEKSQPDLYLLSNYRSVAASGVASYVRALESLAQRDEQQAAAYLRQCLDKEPGNAFANRLLVQLYFNARKFGEVTALYNRLGMGAFQAAPDSLAQIALSFFETGNVEAARRVLVSAQTFFPKSPFLLTAAQKIQ